MTAARSESQGGRGGARTILVHLPNWLGDAVMSAPAIRALMVARPDARLILCGNARSAPPFARLPFHAILRFDGKGIGALLRHSRRLRRLSIDEALVLGPSFRVALPPFLAGVKRRVGERSDGRSILLTEGTPRTTRGRHIAQDYLEAASRLGADPAAPLDPRLPVGADESAAARLRLAAHGAEGDLWVAFAPGATYGETKRWPAEHWIALGRMVAASGRRILLMGGEAERDSCEGIARAIGAAAVSMAGETDLRMAMALLACVAGAVSNDSGLMHLATAAGCPVVGIFGSTDPAWTGPLGAISRVVRLGLPCSPCFATVCPTRIECLRDLQPSLVGRELEQVIEEGRRA